MRARHRLREPETPVDRASDEEIVALLRACRSARDRLLVLVMARAGLRRGELCGLRRGDVHLLADSRALGCEVARAHLHVVRRDDNPNRAWAKSRRQRVVPLDFLVVQAFDSYEFERMRVAAAAGSDFVFVNLFRAPIGAPLRPDAVGELLAAASRRAGLDPAIRPHQLRHAFASNVADAGGGIDVVADLLGHASMYLLAGVFPSRPVPAARRGGRGAQPAGAGRGGPVNGVVTALAAVATAVSPAPPTGESASHVFGDMGVLDEQAVRLAVLVDPRFLAECGWDPAGQVLAPPPDHPQLGWTPPVGPARAAASVTSCVVPGCSRPPGSHGLCRAHRSRQMLRGSIGGRVRRRPGPPRPDPVRPLPGRGLPPRPPGGRVAYCEPHQSRWTRDRRADPGRDEARWRRTTSPVVVTGQVSLAGMPPLITAQVLYGLQQRTRSGAHTRVQMLRLVVEDLRHAQADSVHADSVHADGPAARDGPGEAHAADRAGPARRTRAQRPGNREGQGRVGAGGVRAGGAAEVHHHLAALAAAGGQAVGHRRAPAPPR